MKISTVGLDLAKNVFQVHAIDEAGEVIVRKALRRRRMMPFFNKLEPCLVGMEAYAMSHFWARELSALGHQVRLMPGGGFASTDPPHPRPDFGKDKGHPRNLMLHFFGGSAAAGPRGETEEMPGRPRYRGGVPA